ncbi:AP-1 complex subunit beta-1, partial [Orchesella cincta]
RPYNLPQPSPFGPSLGALDVGNNTAAAPHQHKHQWEVVYWVNIFGWHHLTTTYIAPKTLWLPAVKGKGLEISGTFIRKNGQVSMEMTLTNRAMQAMSGFAVQFNKNSFGVIPAQPLQVPSPLTPNQSCEVSLLLNTSGPVQKMDPLNNLQVAIKNNRVDVLYCCRSHSNARVLLPRPRQIG